MSKECQALRDELIEHAFGRSSKVVDDHVAGCKECGRVLSEFRAMAAAARFELRDAPPTVIDRARALLAPAERVMARVLRTTLSPAGARFVESDTFQAVFEVGGQELRVMYSQTEEGWEVRGRLPERSWKVVRGGRSVALDADLGFVFRVRKAGDTGFEVTTSIGPIGIPAAQVLMTHDSSNPGG